MAPWSRPEPRDTGSAVFHEYFDTVCKRAFNKPRSKFTLSPYEAAWRTLSKPEGLPYTIFETMNDRGLQLSPIDMLKGYLLNSVSDSAKRATCNELWKQRVQQVAGLGKDLDADCFKFGCGANTPKPSATENAMPSRATSTEPVPNSIDGFAIHISNSG